MCTYHMICILRRLSIYQFIFILFCICISKLRAKLHKPTNLVKIVL